MSASISVSRNSIIKQRRRVGVDDVGACALRRRTKPRVRWLVVSPSSQHSVIGRPGEHTSGPNVASRDNVAHKPQSIYDSGNAAKSLLTDAFEADRNAAGKSTAGRHNHVTMSLCELLESIGGAGD